MPEPRQLDTRWADGGATPARALERGAPLLLALLALLTWAGSVARGGFAYDDREVLFDNPVVEGALPLASVFDRDYWHHLGDAGQWRPLATASLRLDRQLYGEDSRGYHATNVALHALVVALAALVARRLASALGAPYPWFGLALLACHPLLADSVAWISGRTSMLSAVGGLVGAWLVSLGAGAARPFAPCAAGAGLGVALALQGKEDGLVFAALLPLVAYASRAHRGERRATLGAGLGATLGATLAVGAWLGARALALGAAWPSARHALLADEPLPVRLAYGLAAWGEGLAVALVPFLRLPPNLTPEDVRGALAGRVALFAALAGAAAFCAWRARRRALAAGADGAVRFATGSALAALVALAPLVQLVPSGELFAPRFLYLPLLLGAPALSALLRALPAAGPRAATRAADARRRAAAQRVVATLAIATCVALAQGSAARYAGRRAYWTAHLPRHASDPRVWNELGNAAREEGDRGAAREAFERARTLAPGYSRAWVNLGTLALEDGDLDAALAALREGARVGPDNAAAHANLGNALLRDGDAPGAVEAYGRAVHLAPGRAAFHRGLARALARAGDAVGARAALHEALARSPDDPRSRALASELGLTPAPD